MGHEDHGAVLTDVVSGVTDDLGLCGWDTLNWGSVVCGYALVFTLRSRNENGKKREVRTWVTENDSGGNFSGGSGWKLFGRIVHQLTSLGVTGND